MIQKAKKKTLFLVGLVFSAILGSVTGHLHSNYSKGESLFVATANADVTDYGGATTWTGDGCGGCSGGAGASD